MVGSGGFGGVYRPLDAQQSCFEGGYFGFVTIGKSSVRKGEAGSPSLL